MGRTMPSRTAPSFRLSLAEEKSEWRDYRKHLAHSERKDFDDISAISRLYISACSGAASLVRIHSIFISVIFFFFHYYKELIEIAPQIGVMREQII